MKYKLKELSLNLIDTFLYEMYQDIPSGENGQTNKAYGLTKKEFKQYVLTQIKRKYNQVTFYDTPTITYIMYVNGYPVGFICLRTKIDDNWLKWSGNFYYQIRTTERRKGYATEILRQICLVAKEHGLKQLQLSVEKDNVASIKTIEKNGGEFSRSFIFENEEAYVYLLRL